MTKSHGEIAGDDVVPGIGTCLSKSRFIQIGLFDSAQSCPPIGTSHGLRNAWAQTRIVGQQIIEAQPLLADCSPPGPAAPLGLIIPFQHVEQQDSQCAFELVELFAARKTRSPRLDCPDRAHSTVPRADGGPAPAARNRSRVRKPRSPAHRRARDQLVFSWTCAHCYHFRPRSPHERSDMRATASRGMSPDIASLIRATLLHRRSPDYTRCT